MEALTSRQADILKAVVESFVTTGRPVGSRRLHSGGGFELAPSTLRNELAGLERLGYLDHPHTSAGRIPTDKGYRFYVDHLSRERRRPADQRRISLSEGELEEALRQAAGALAGATGLMAMVSAPSQENSEVRHVEVIQLNPDLVLVVVITAAGGVVKKLVLFDGEVDSGLVAWARGFLNDAICGMDLGSRRLLLRLREPELSAAESGFVEALAPAFAAGHPDGDLYMDGVSRFFARMEEDGSPRVHYLMEMLDRREEIIELLGEAMSEASLCLRIGRELPRRILRDCSLVAATYGVPRRSLGAVGVLGPMRMDYAAVINNVRRVASSLSRYVEEIYQ